MGPVQTKINHVLTSSEGPSNKFHLKYQEFFNGFKSKTWKLAWSTCVYSPRALYGIRENMVTLSFMLYMWLQHYLLQQSQESWWFNIRDLNFLLVFCQTTIEHGIKYRATCSQHILMCWYRLSMTYNRINNENMYSRF